MKKSMNEYFEYIKVIYLNEFSSYMTQSTRNEIQAMNDIFEWNEELMFRVIQDKKIIFHLNLPKFIEENDLKNEETLVDISVQGKDYIHYLIENENNVYAIVKNKILKEIIKYFLKCDKSVISLGVADIIVDYLKVKYKLPCEDWIPSKEKEVAVYLKEIVGEKVLLSGMISNQEQIVQDAYNAYIENNELESYEELKTTLDKVYLDYFKKIGKVYFTDSLYEYENLNYGVSGLSKQVKEEKTKLSMVHLKRLASLKNSLMNIQQHQFLFTVRERMLIENNIIETDKILNAIMVDGKENVLEHIDSQYDKILKIEEESVPFVQTIWNHILTNISGYQDGNEFSFLLTNQLNSSIIEANYISSEHLKNIRTSRNDYGFIIEPKKNIIYASSKDILYRNYQDDTSYSINKNTVYAGDIPLEIDNQETSKLITPSMILKDNLQDHMIQNKILLTSKDVRVLGIYVFADEEDSPSYNKAVLLSEEYELPIVRISPRSYFKGREEHKTKMDIKIQPIEVPQKSFFDRLKEARNKLFYEDSETNQKVAS